MLIFLLIMMWPVSFALGAWATRYMAKRALEKVLKEVPALRTLLGGQAGGGEN